MSARSIRRSHARRIARERRRVAQARQRALLAGATLAAAAEAAWRIEEDFDPAPALARLFRAALVTALM